MTLRTKIGFIILLLVIQGIFPKDTLAFNKQSNVLNVDSSSSRKVNLFVVAGYAPFKMAFGAGYFINPQIEINFQYSGYFLPLSIDAITYSIGGRFYENEYGSSTFYSLSAGGAIQSQDENSPLGFCLEGGLGYSFESKIGLYFSPSFKAGGIFFEGKPPHGILGLDLTFGWYIKY